MKTNLIVFLVAAAFGVIASGLAQTKTPSPPAAAVARTEASGPRIVFAESSFDFGKVSSGEIAKHNFVFTNTGNALLEITDVRPSCGCTTAGDWDKRIEPGKSGVIPLQFNSAGFAGTITKSATVTCNDPGKSNVVLQMTCTVWKPIEVTPLFAMFNFGQEDAQTNQTKVVRIINNLDEALTLSEPTVTNRSFRAALTTVREGKEFELSVSVVPPLDPGTVSAPITLKTSSPKMPVLNVTAYAVVESAVTVMPRQIMMPAGPFASAMSTAVRILNNGTNSLALSDASVNYPDVTVQVQEIQPGRQFRLTVNFPTGFLIKSGQQVEVSVKSNNPRLPVIKVPIHQAQPSPAQALAVPGAEQRASPAVQSGSNSPASPVSAGK